MRRYTAGDRVQQAQYGVGTIVDVNEHHTVIEFDEHGKRDLLDPFVHRHVHRPMVSLSRRPSGLMRWRSSKRFNASITSSS